MPELVGPKIGMPFERRSILVSSHDGGLRRVERVHWTPCHCHLFHPLCTRRALSACRTVRACRNRNSFVCASAVSCGLPQERAAPGPARKPLVWRGPRILDKGSNRCRPSFRFPSAPLSECRSCRRKRPKLRLQDTPRNVARWKPSLKGYSGCLLAIHSVLTPTYDYVDRHLRLAVAHSGPSAGGRPIGILGKILRLSRIALLA